MKIMKSVLALGKTVRRLGRLEPLASGSGTRNSETSSKEISLGENVFGTGDIVDLAEGVIGNSTRRGAIKGKDNIPDPLRGEIFSRFGRENTTAIGSIGATNEK